MLESYDDVDIIGEASNGEEAVSTIERLRPTVVVMDINMPKKNGIQATAEIKARWPDIIVIGLSVNPERRQFESYEKGGGDIAADQGSCGRPTRIRRSGRRWPRWGRRDRLRIRHLFLKQYSGSSSELMRAFYW